MVKNRELGILTSSTASIQPRQNSETSTINPISFSCLHGRYWVSIYIIYIIYIIRVSAKLRIFSHFQTTPPPISMSYEWKPSCTSLQRMGTFLYNNQKHLFCTSEPNGRSLSQWVYAIWDCCLLVEALYHTDWLPPV